MTIFINPKRQYENIAYYTKDRTNAKAAIRVLRDMFLTEKVFLNIQREDGSWSKKKILNSLSLWQRIKNNKVKVQIQIGINLIVMRKKELVLTQKQLNVLLDKEPKLTKAERDLILTKRKLRMILAGNKGRDARNKAIKKEFEEVRKENLKRHLESLERTKK